MDYSRTYHEGPIKVPATATRVKVTHVLNPYIITFVEVNDYDKKFNAINIKLHVTVRKKRFMSWNTREPGKPGNAVIGVDSQGKNENIKYYLYRGLIEHFDELSKKYSVFLVDCGYALELRRNQFVIVPHDFIPNEHLTSTIGLYNIVPSIATKHMFSEFGCNALIWKNWSTPAIQFMKELIIASSATYFDCLAVDESGRKYGNLYLTIENKIVSLRKSLVFNHYAEYLEDLHHFIKNPNKRSNAERNDNLIIFLSQPTNSYLYRESENSLDCEHGKSDLPYNVTASSPYDNILRKPGMHDEKQNMLIYSSVTYDLVSDVADAKFPAGVHAAWDSLVHSLRPTKIQSHVWPAIMRCSNVVAIGVPDSGKTFAYTAAVSALLATHNKLQLPQGTKPSALILCSSTSQTLSVQALFVQFLQKYDAVRIVAAFNGKPDRTFVAEVYSGCQVLITTPRYLTRFINRNKRILNFEWLRYLVLDRADVVLEKYSDAIGELFTKHNVIANREKQYSDVPVLQMIMVARRCTQYLKNIAFTLMDEPYICIGSFIEACVFKSIHPTLLVTNTQNKKQKILQILTEKRSSHLKNMVICTNAEEAEELHQFLSLNNTYLAHENMSIINLQSIVRRFKDTLSINPIFICTDQVLSELNITDIDCLIHYSVLMDLQTQFNFRFSTLLDNLRKEKSDCEVFIFIDENNDIQFQSIVETVHRMKIPIPTTIMDCAKRISATIDRNKGNVPICDNVKSFGFCPDRSTCVFRHCILPDIDKPMTPIKIGDKVKFMILCIHNATHFSARITEYTKTDGNKPETITLSSKDYVELPLKIHTFYSDKNKRRKCATVNVGDICALEDSIENFRRVQVLYFEEETTDCFGGTKFVCVRCIDSGIILDHVSLNRLLWIPDELSNVPSHVVEVFLAGIVPYDNEYDWSNFANDAVHKWFTENFHDRSYVLGEVLLHVGNTIWVETLKIGTKLIGYPDLISSSLKTELIKKDYALADEHYMNRLNDIYANAEPTKINESDP